MKLTQQEANALIEMIKKEVEKQQLKFPERREKCVFDVIGERKNDEFVVNIERKGINYSSATYQGRIKSNNVILMRLDINPTSKHRNPSDGEIIEGSHLHIYSEEWELKEAVPFDTENKDLYDLCYIFFEKFNIIESPAFIEQKTIQLMENYHEHFRNA